jgi:hypothetical protein
MCSGDTLPAAFTGCAWAAVIFFWALCLLQIRWIGYMSGLFQEINSVYSRIAAFFLIPHA